MTGPDPVDPVDHVDVVVIGDGPAGVALAAACHRRGLGATVVGPGAPWTNTYGVWVDEVADLAPFVGAEDPPFTSVRTSAVAVGERIHHLDRSYAVVDAAALRARLLDGPNHRIGTVQRVWTVGDRHRVAIAPSGPEHVEHEPHEVVSCRYVIDATGSPGTFLPRHRSGASPAWQTAYGVVLDELPPRIGSADSVTFMDLSALAGDDPDGVATFCYAVPVHDGWLVEETVLAARPPVPPDSLRTRLEARLGPDGPELVAGARRVERVGFPMGGPVRAGAGGVVAFGAAAGYVNPASGFSLATSLRRAEQVADAIADGRDPAAVVWTTSMRRTRALHEYGADVLVRLSGEELRRFFDVFFDLPVDRWSTYLRSDANPTALAAVMAQVFRSAPWSIRARLARGDPRRLVWPWRG